MSSTTTMPRTSLSFKERMFRSTVYNRHEARRAKTLLRKGDQRPALLRVFAAAPPITGPVVHSTKSSSEEATSSCLDQSHQPPPTLVFEDDSVFTKYDDVPNAANVPQRQSSVLTSAVAASVGAVLSETFYGARCLRQASPFANHHYHHHHSTGRAVATPAGQPHVVVLTQEYASLMLQSTPQSVIHRPPFTTTSSTMFSGISNAQLASRAAPFALLFGVKSSVEHLLLSSTSTGTMEKSRHIPSVAISVLSSAAAGGVLGSLRSILTSHHHRLVSSVVGREVAAATLYFTLYDGIKHVISHRHRRRQQQQQSATTQDGNSSFKPLAIISAGAISGVVYESVRACGQLTVGATTSLATTTAATATAVPARSWATTALRAAPSHALLFLGYEATLQLVASQQAC